MKTLIFNSLPPLIWVLLFLGFFVFYLFLNLQKIQLVNLTIERPGSRFVYLVLSIPLKCEGFSKYLLFIVKNRRFVTHISSFIRFVIKPCSIVISITFNIRFNMHIFSVIYNRYIPRSIGINSNKYEIKIKESGSFKAFYY